MTSKNATFLISSKMQKEIQCVGTGIAMDKMLAEGEISVKLQEDFMFNTFHGKRNYPNSIGLVETILSGAGIVEDMYFSKEVDITDPNTSTESTASYLQMNDICTLDPGTAYIVGKLITKDVLHGSTKKVGGPWSMGRALLTQSKEVHKNCKKALGYGTKFLDADGFVKSGNHQPDYFRFVNNEMHKLKHPEMHEENELGQMIGHGKPDGWMFNGYIYFVLYSPRVEKDLDNSNVSACFSTGDENLTGEKGSHSTCSEGLSWTIVGSHCRTRPNSLGTLAVL
jgi:hypothetical protein